MREKGEGRKRRREKGGRKEGERREKGGRKEEGGRGKGETFYGKHGK
jgi:hypothetical protein